MPLSKNPKTPPKTIFFLQKKTDVHDFWNAPSIMFLNYQKMCYWGCFEESPILSALKEKIFNKIKKSNRIKPQENLPFQDVKYLLESVFKNYLYLLPDPFCVPIFHPISETESYGILQSILTVIHLPLCFVISNLANKKAETDWLYNNARTRQSPLIILA